MPVLNTNKVYASVADGQYVILNFVSGAYYSLNTPSTAVLQDILEGAPESEVEAALARIWPAEDVHGALQAFLDRLYGLEVLCPEEASAAAAAVHCAALPAGGELDLRVDEYNDVADLLLMDPIHEVSEDAGWPNQ